MKNLISWPKRYRSCFFKIAPHDRNRLHGSTSSAAYYFPAHSPHDLLLRICLSLSNTLPMTLLKASVRPKMRIYTEACPRMTLANSLSRKSLVVNPHKRPKAPAQPTECNDIIKIRIARTGWLLLLCRPFLLPRLIRMFSKNLLISGVEFKVMKWLFFQQNYRCCNYCLPNI